MYNNDEKEEMEAEAIRLIDFAEDLADRGKGNESIEEYEKAAQIHLDLGSYIKLDEIYIRITQIISQFKSNIQATYRLKSIIRKTEELKLYEISAKLLIQLGNISFRMKDWEIAGESWESASNYLYESDPEEYSSLSSILLLEAGQALERSHITKDKGKRLILKAVMKINEFDELYQEEEKQARILIINKEFEAAAEKFYTISTYFKKSLTNLDELLQNAESKDTTLNTKARFIHFVAEYQTVSAICLIATKKADFKERIEKLGKNSIKLFKESISLLKDYLFKIKKDFDREIILRITFDTMLLAIIQRILGSKEIKCRDYLLNGIEENKALTKSLKKSPYYKIVEKIEIAGLTDALDDLLLINLGHFEKIKNILISNFKQN
jgi:tetratricopeptide (TPR) repeat protein